MVGPVEICRSGWTDSPGLNEMRSPWLQRTWFSMSNLPYQTYWSFSASSSGSAPLLWSPNLSHNHCKSFGIIVVESDRTLELIQRPFLNYALPNMEVPQGGSERDKPPNSSSSTSPLSVVSSFWKGNSLIVNRILFQFVRLLVGLDLMIIQLKKITCSVLRSDSW